MGLKEPANKKKGLIIAIAVVSLTLVLAVSSAFMGGMASPVSNILGVIAKPFQSLITGFADGVASFYGYIHDYDSIKAENEQLRLQIARMEESARLSQSALEENERLRKRLGLSERRREFDLEQATITAWTSSNWASSFTISKGSNSGIKPNDCVVNEENFLLGFVSEVGANWATVTTLIDTDMEVGATIFRTGQLGVAEGNFDLMRQGFLQLSYLSKEVDLQNGDLALTSGIGGIYPSDLVIGTVVEVSTAPTGISAVATIKPAADLAEIRHVFVIKSYEISE